MLLLILCFEDSDKDLNMQFSQLSGTSLFSIKVNLKQLPQLYSQGSQNHEPDVQGYCFFQSGLPKCITTLYHKYRVPRGP